MWSCPSWYDTVIQLAWYSDTAGMIQWYRWHGSGHTWEGCLEGLCEGWRSRALLFSGRGWGEERMMWSRGEKGIALHCNHSCPHYIILSQAVTLLDKLKHVQVWWTTPGTGMVLWFSHCKPHPHFDGLFKRQRLKKQIHQILQGKLNAAVLDIANST